MIGATISDAEFDRLRRFFEQASGIRLADSKKLLVCGRLAKRLRAVGVASYRAYADLIERADHADERQTAVDLLTTNETHFFREPRHFEHLRQVLPQLRRPGGVRVWSAACSTGEEPYSLAMTLAEVLGSAPWEVLASDLSTRVLDDARRGVYGSDRAAEVPAALNRKYLLEGVDECAGLFRVDAALRERVQFRQVNLMKPLPPLEPFDVIFLRNVLIYFDTPAKKTIVEALVRCLRPGGLLYIGHSETLTGVTSVAEQVAPTIYRRPA
jgi:chemotaxis protein methyltransferase CheR